jgi:hypothetical protein
MIKTATDQPNIPRHHSECPQILRLRHPIIILAPNRRLQRFIQVKVVLAELGLNLMGIDGLELVVAGLAVDLEGWDEVGGRGGQGC